MRAKPDEVILAHRRCITCKGTFDQPWLNYIFLDCPPCRRAARLPVVSWFAVEYAPPEVVREQEIRLGPIEIPDRPVKKKRKA